MVFLFCIRPDSTFEIMLNRFEVKRFSEIKFI